MEQAGSFLQAKDLNRADAVALAATKATFEQWKRKQLEKLCDEFTDYVYEQEFAQTALRQAARRPDLYSAKDLDFWRKKNVNAEARMFGLSYEIAVLTFSYFSRWRMSFVPLQLRRFRELQQESG